MNPGRSGTNQREKNIFQLLFYAQGVDIARGAACLIWHMPDALPYTTPKRICLFSRDQTGDLLFVSQISKPLHYEAIGNQS